ncbi:MAG TPA: hypothetical protein VGF48_04845 [Thermoanaerobaculia bacterium]|jgi:hypothetical protein
MALPKRLQHVRDTSAPHAWISLDISGFPTRHPYGLALRQNHIERILAEWVTDRWGLSRQITPRALTEPMTAGGDEAKRAFEAMMTMQKIDIGRIEAARRG